MSYDLFFCKPNGSIPSATEIKTYFSALPFFRITDQEDGGVDVFYENEATGVHCTFAYSPEDADDSGYCGSSGLSFNINFNRPSYFAYEAMPLVTAFAKHFDLMVEEPSGETVATDTDRLISSWRDSNTSAMHAFAKLAKQEGGELHYFPEPRATAWWRYMRIRQSIEDALTEDLFVPSIMVLLNPSGRLFRMIVWPNGIAQFFPPCEYVYIERVKRRFFGKKEEAGLVRYQTVLETIGPLLDEYDFGGLRIKYLSRQRKPEVAPLINKWQLEPIDFEQHTQLAGGGFHDVKL